MARKRLGEMLEEAGVIDAAGLAAALAHQRQWGVRLGQALVELRIASERDIVHALSRKLGLEVAVLDGLAGPELDAALKLVPREFAVRHNVLPMSDDGTVLTLAMSDPVNVTVVDELAFRSGRRVKVTIGGDQEIGQALLRHYAPPADKVEAIDLAEEPSDAAPMSLVGQEVVPGDPDSEWKRRASRDRHGATAPAPRPAAPAADVRRRPRGMVPQADFEVEKTAEMALTGDYPLSPDEPELLPEDAMEPMLEPVEEEPVPEPPGLDLPGRPAEARPRSAQPQRAAGRAAQVVARLAARGAHDPELADAARVLAAALRVLLAKGTVTDEEIAEELRKGEE